jgi:putative DNA primase/helicase
MNISEFLTKFQGVKRTPGGHQAKCPAHKDRIASLSISNGGGKILLYCHAGCTVEAVVGALGLRMADLFDEPPERDGLYFKGAPVVAAYEYRDAGGKLVYRVLRNANKNFSQQRLENGEWVWKGPEKKLLYRLPELLAADPDQPVFIPEGEKDVDETLRAWGLVATTNSGGAGKFSQDNEALRGRLVVTLEDNDPAGAAHVPDVARKLKGVARRVVNLKLDGLPPHGDVTDWKRAGHTKDELLALVAAALARPKEAFAPSETLLRPKELTVMGLAARFHERYYRETRYVEARGAFYNYEGGVWKASLCCVEVKVKHIINEVHDELVDVRKRLKELQDRQKAGDQTVLAELGELAQYWENLEKFAMHIKKPKTMNDVLNFGRSDLVIDPDEFDANRSLLNVKNGVINLETGEFCPHRPEDLCSMQSPVTYNPGAVAERWERFLGEIFLGDQELIAFIKRAVGYSISGWTSEQVFLILHGDGSNGKSELLSVLALLLGSYLRNANVDTFMDDKPQGGHNEDIARLRGARLVTTSETEKTRRLAESLVKRLTGEDKITASYKHERTFEFTPRFKVWLAANHKPNVSGTDYGLWRRILLVPFHAKFLKPGVELGDKQFRIDPNLKADLAKELSGILNWAIAGYQEWRRDGLNPPAVVRAASEEYREESDRIGAFLKEEMIEAYIPATLAATYEAYRKWCEDGGMKPMSKRGLSSDLRARGIEVNKWGVNNDTSVIGWALLAKE